MKSKRKKSIKESAPKGSAEKKSSLTEFFKNPLFSSRAFEILLFCLIMGLALMGGLLLLNSDPPHISWSQDVATDPPQYTYFARNNVLWGSWDLFGHNRFVFFLKSFSSLASYIVLSIFGTGRFQANLVAVILNLLTMLLLFLAMKKVFGKRAAFLSLFFLAVNFVFTMYGRNPFLEISAMFLLTLGFYFMVLSFTKSLLLIPSGICFAAAVFFGKTMAAFILPACFGVLLLWMFDHSTQTSRKVDFKPALLFAAGFLSVTVFWIFFSYLPAKKEVAGYLGEQALGLYGFPVALQSVLGFIDALFTFGTDVVFVSFFYRMPVVFVLSLWGLLLLFRNAGPVKKLIKRRDPRSKSELFLVLWFLVAFFLLMILNYRPLRYQLYLIPPMCAMAGLWLDSFLSSFDSKGKRSPGIFFWIVFAVAATFCVNHVINTYYLLGEKPVPLLYTLLVSLAITLLLGVLYAWRLARSKARAKGDSAARPRRLSLGQRLLTVLALALISLTVNGLQYASWASNPTYSLYQSSLDLGEILNDQAVVSGPYGPALAWDNQLKNLIHMFGVTKPDPELFLTYPITHLALERGKNQERAFQDYPQVMNRAKVVVTYWLRNIPVDIYRIGEWTGNPETERYQLSDFEKAKSLKEAGKGDSALVVLEKFVSEHPNSFSGYQALAELYFNIPQLEKSISSLRRAAGFHPTDFVIRQQLGSVYMVMASVTGDDSYRSMGIDQWEKSLELFPGNAQLAEELERVKGY